MPYLYQCVDCKKKFSSDLMESSGPCPRCGRQGAIFIQYYKEAISGGAWPPNYDEIDKESRRLVRALNELPGIRTRESCCGHSTRSFWIMFTVQGLEFLSDMLRILQSHLRSEKWRVAAEPAPPGRPEELVWFRLVSLDRAGMESYNAADDLACWIEENSQ